MIKCDFMSNSIIHKIKEIIPTGNDISGIMDSTREKIILLSSLNKNVFGKDYSCNESSKVITISFISVISFVISLLILSNKLYPSSFIRNFCIFPSYEIIS